MCFDTFCDIIGNQTKNIMIITQQKSRNVLKLFPCDDTRFKNTSVFKP